MCCQRISTTPSQQREQLTVGRTDYKESYRALLGFLDFCIVVGCISFTRGQCTGNQIVRRPPEPFGMITRTNAHAPYFRQTLPPGRALCNLDFLHHFFAS